MWQFVRLLISKTRESRALRQSPSERRSKPKQMSRRPHAAQIIAEAPLSPPCQLARKAARNSGGKLKAQPPGMLVGAKPRRKIQRTPTERLSGNSPRNLLLPCSRPSSRLSWVCTCTGKGSPAWRKTQRSGIGMSGSSPGTSSSGRTRRRAPPGEPERSARRAAQGTARVRPRREASPAQRRGAGCAPRAPRHFLKRTKRRGEASRRHCPGALPYKIPVLQ